MGKTRRDYLSRSGCYVKSQTAPRATQDVDVTVEVEREEAVDDVGGP